MSENTVFIFSLYSVFLHAGWKTEDHLCVFEITFTSQGTISKPTLLNSKHLPGENYCDCS